MNVMSKLAVLAVCCAGAIGMAQPAKADSFSIGYHSGGWGGWHHSGYSVSLGVGPAYYGGGYYYGPGYYAGPRCYFDYYGYRHCPTYYGGAYYGPAVSVGYYNGWGRPWYGGGWYRSGWYGNGWGWRGGGWHGHDGDHDGDGHHHAGGWDHGHYRNASGNNSQRNGNGNNWQHH